jgi:hypothetical protein
VVDPGAPLERDDSTKPVSRRRIFGLLGGAAAAGAGLAVATASPASATPVTTGAANGDAVQLGGFNVCTAQTTVQANDVIALFTNGTAVDSCAVYGQSNSGSGAIGVSGSASSGIGLVGAGGRASLRLVPRQTGTGAPASGSHSLGEFSVDSTGALFYCVGAGAPGTWVSLSSASGHLITLASPARVYDSRTGQANQAPNVQGALSYTSPPPAAALRDIACNKDASSGATVVPPGARTLLLNLTVIALSGGGALSVYAAGTTQPATSSINWTAAGQVAANSVTSACSVTQHVDVAIVAGPGASANFILDVIGYYV